MRTVVLFVSVLGLVAPEIVRGDEQAILADVDKAAIEHDTREIVQYRRDGGSEDERNAIDYIVRALRAEGIDVDVVEFPGYVSDPGDCRLTVTGASPSRPECRTQALAAPSPPGGARGELVVAGAGEPADYETIDATGKVVLVDALPLPWGVKNAEDAGAVGAIFTATAELIQELTVSPVWGTPTHLNLDTLPTIPSVNIKRSDAEALKEAAASGSVEVSIETSVDTRFETLRLPIATIVGGADGADEDGFVLVGGHIDGWHYAAVDEAASNAAMAEMARVFHRHRNEMRRSLKVAWWPAHSNGRYAGSAGFVDLYWLELRKHALAYLNIDGVGQIGASRYSSSNTAAMDALAKAVLLDVGGVDARQSRPGRNSDQGFYGIGLPLLQFNHGREDPGGRYWFWHTTEDTIDKVDFDVLTGDTKLYVAALARLVTPPVPPLRLSAETSEFLKHLRERQDAAGSRLDLSRAIAQAVELDGLAKRLDERLPTSSRDSGEIARLMVSMLRPLLRLTFQRNGPYHQDPALFVPTLPGLAAIDELGGADGDGLKFTLNHLVKERNRLVDHLDRALVEARTLEARLAAN